MTKTIVFASPRDPKNGFSRAISPLNFPAKRFPEVEKWPDLHIIFYFFSQNDVISRYNCSFCPRFTIFFLLFSKPKRWIEVRDCRPKKFYFFQSRNTEFRYAICDRQIFTFFVAGHTPFRLAIGDEKIKFCRRGHHRFQCFATKKVKHFQSTITYAVFYFFFVPKQA